MAFNYADAAHATSLVRAIIRNDRKEVRDALFQGFNPNLPDNRGWTPIHEAASDDARFDCLKELLGHRFTDINALTFLGESPLFLASQNNCVKSVQLLLKQTKCKVNQANSEGVSPLHAACSPHACYPWKQNLRVIQLLVDFGANINWQDFNGYTPLHEVVSSGSGIEDSRDKVSYKICQYLLNHGAIPDVLEYEGNYPFHFACQNGLVRSAELLYRSSKQSGMINFTNKDGRTPFMMGVQSKNLPTIEMLLHEGANPNVVDHYNVTALHLAAHSGNFDVFTLVRKAMSDEFILRYCTFDEERDYESLKRIKRINSVVCLAIDTEDFDFLNNVLECDLDPSVLKCPVVHAENSAKKSFTLHTPISFLLESKMFEMGEATYDFLLTLINHGSPLKMSSKNSWINYIDPICAGLISLNDFPPSTVVRCLEALLQHGADPDEPYGGMPFAMEQACMRKCPEAVLLLLQYSSVLDADDVIKWIEQETSSNQEKIVEMLLPLAPYYTPSDKLLPDLVDSPRRKILLAATVRPLTSYCRAVIRKQLHEAAKSDPSSIHEKLLGLGLPRDIYNFIRYM